MPGETGPPTRGEVPGSGRARRDHTAPQARRSLPATGEGRGTGRHEGIGSQTGRRAATGAWAGPRGRSRGDEEDARQTERRREEDAHPEKGAGKFFRARETPAGARVLRGCRQDAGIGKTRRGGPKAGGPRTQSPAGGRRSSMDDHAPRSSRSGRQSQRASQDAHETFNVRECSSRGGSPSSRKGPIRSNPYAFMTSLIRNVSFPAPRSSHATLHPQPPRHSRVFVSGTPHSLPSTRTPW